jgi:hypothetical protein
MLMSMYVFNIFISYNYNYNVNCVISLLIYSMGLLPEFLNFNRRLIP